MALAVGEADVRNAILQRAGRVLVEGAELALVRREGPLVHPVGQLVRRPRLAADGGAAVRGPRQIRETTQPRVSRGRGRLRGDALAVQPERQAVRVLVPVGSPPEGLTLLLLEHVDGLRLRSQCGLAGRRLQPPRRVPGRAVQRVLDRRARRRHGVQLDGLRQRLLLGLRLTRLLLLHLLRPCAIVGVLEGLVERVHAPQEALLLVVRPGAVPPRQVLQVFVEEPGQKRGPLGASGLGVAAAAARCAGAAARLGEGTGKRRECRTRGRLWRGAMAAAALHRCPRAPRAARGVGERAAEASSRPPRRRPA
mmetsp:Transcript_93015/g.260059  ORF Transcript_93015/g.260059 Transcript_93015/m.260059 type:complete len:309 (+) Transcript_93015:580-1506(+)